MLFFGKRKTDTTASETGPKRRSTLGLLFNPEIGAAIRPLGETTSVFIQLIAMVFAMNGLFPKNHPGMTGDPNNPVRLRLSDIIRTAWSGLSFTKEGAPKVLLFFAVVGTLVFAVLSVITALFVGFVGHAHAQTTTSYFAPIDATKDLAQNWLDFLFKGQPLSQLYDDGSGTLQKLGSANDIQCAMITALGFYSNAMLVFAGFILFYHLASMVVSTAHEGVVMGKRANQVWAPIRLVVAVGLLVPVGSGPTNCNTTAGAGLNSGQYIVIQMASWGSGLASQVWKTFLTSMTKQYTYIAPSTPTIDTLVRNMALIEACRYAYNYDYWVTHKTADISDVYIGGDFTGSDTYPDTGFSAPSSYLFPAVQPADATTFLYGSNSLGTNDNICGSVTLKDIPTWTGGSAVPFSFSAPAGIIKAEATAFTGMGDELAKLGANVLFFIEPSSTSISDMPDTTIIQTTVDDYQTKLKDSLDQNLTTGALTDQSAAQDIITWSSQGWAVAGAWLNKIASIQGAIVSANDGSVPEIIPFPDTSRLGDNIQSQLRSFNLWLNGLPTTVNSIGAGQTNSAAVKAAACANGRQQQDAAEKGLKKEAEQQNSVLKVVLLLVEQYAKSTELWDFSAQCGGKTPSGNDYFSLGQQLHTVNPLAEIANWGFDNIIVAYKLLDGDDGIFNTSLKLANTELKIRANQMNDYGKQNGIQQKYAKEMFEQVTIPQWKMNIKSMVAMIFFSCGFTLAFVVPLMPFFRFFFNILAWLVSLLEAIVAVPMVALAHLNPEGEGLPGPSAKAAYYMIFSIFLRPVMMVFGLICGLLIFIVALIFLNTTYGIAVAGTGAMLHGYGTLVRILYTLTYGATVYVCANNCFKTIGFFPENAVRWLGGQSHHDKIGDGGRAVQGVMGQAQGHFGQKAIDVAKVTKGSMGGGG